MVMGKIPQFYSYPNATELCFSFTVYIIFRPCMIVWLASLNCCLCACFRTHVAVVAAQVPACRIPAAQRIAIANVTLESADKLTRTVDGEQNEPLKLEEICQRLK